MKKISKRLSALFLSGVKHVYDVTDGEKQGEIGDF